MEDALCEAKDRASTMKEDDMAVKVLASKVVAEAVEAFRDGEEYYL